MIFLDGRLVQNLAPTHEDRHEKLVVFHIYLSENFRQVSEKDTHIFEIKCDWFEWICGWWEKKNTKTNSISHSGDGVPHAVQDEWEGNTNQLVQGGKMMTITNKLALGEKNVLGVFWVKTTDASWWATFALSFIPIKPKTSMNLPQNPEKKYNCGTVGKIKKRPNKKHDPKIKHKLLFQKNLFCVRLKH